MINNLKQFFQEKRFNFIDKIHKQYPKATVFLVGGAVRDILAENSKFKTLNPKQAQNHQITKSPNNIPAEDLDFVVEGISRDELEKFLEKNGTVKDVESRAFGVFVFVPKKLKSYNLQPESFDIALPRDEHWIGGGYKDIEVKTEGLTLKDDLSRRDFTINAMAIDLQTYKLIDLFGGQKDLENKIISTVGRPEERFQEDPSRILRGIRFAIQLDFKIEKKTFAAMKEMIGEIRRPIDSSSATQNDNHLSSLRERRRPKDLTKYRVSEEVIAKEFLKAFAKNPVRTLKIYDKVGLLKLLLPEVKKMQGVEQPKNFHSEGDVYEHTLLALKKLKTANINLKLATLFHDIGKPVTFTPPKDKNDRIHFNEHDEKGAEIAKKIIERLRLTSMSPDSGLHADEEIVLWLVSKHMILVTAKPEEMRLTTFEKYFFREDGAGDDLLRLSWADISATVPPSGKPDFLIYNAFVKKIEEVRSAVHAAKKERTLPPPLISGNEVMKVLKIKSGPEVGKVLAQIRERQLAGKLKNKKEALLFLSKDRQNKSDKDS